MLVELICSLVVVSLSIGAVSADKEISVGWLKFGVAPWMFIFGGAALCAVLFVY
jgi:hypothetical protein